jgi:hypothetical protein
MLINEFLFVCLLLICRLWYHHHVFMREIKWNHDLRPPFSHIKTIYTSLLVLLFLVLITTKNTFTYYFYFVKLPSYECMTATQVSWGHKTVVYCYRLLEEYMSEKHHFPRRGRYKISSHPCGENFSCCISLRLESQQVANSKSKIAAIMCSWSVNASFRATWKGMA